MTCSRCHEEKPDERFSWRFKDRGIRNVACKDCHRLYLQGHYQRNKRMYLDCAKRTTDKRREQIRSAKRRPCADCGVEYPSYVMDFDHLGDKEFNVSASILFAGQQRIANEIAKCEVVCSNCHRERTYRRRQAGRIV